jgi:hypothetical protein
MHSKIFALSLTAAVCLAGCGGQAPTSPTVSGGIAPSGRLFAASGGDVSTSFDVRALAGRFINVLTGAPAAGVSLNVEGVGEVAAGADGQFSLDTEAPDGRYRVTATAPGFVARQTTLSFPGEPPVISLIPASFNMTAFDQLVRQFGVHTNVTKRWTQAPALVIETSLVDPQSVPGGVPEYNAIASADQLSEASINELIAHLNSALPLMSAGNFPAFSSIEISTTPAGAPIPVDRLGTITALRYNGLSPRCQGFTFFGYDSEAFTAMSAALFMQTCTDSPTAAVPMSAIVAHELGHALGFGHSSAAPSLMTPTVNSGMTDFDRQAVAIAFQRAAGNQAPDVDPDVPVNQPMRRGFGRTRVAGPIQ